MSSVETASNGSGSNSSVPNQTPHNELEHMYLYNMPAGPRRSLCMILDQNDAWQDLAEHMGYTKMDIQDIKDKSKQLQISPTDKLLYEWGELNHNVTELFMLLYRMPQYIAMNSICSLVDRRYHRLIVKDQPDLCALMSNQSLRSISNDVNVRNILGDDKNIKSEKIMNGPAVSREDNESAGSQPKKVTVNNNNQSVRSTFDNINISIPQIDYKELVIATDNWAPENLLGKGGFGVVFKGNWKFTAVAIKRIEYHSSDPDKNTRVNLQQSLNELQHLNSCRHDNILPLYGYSIDGRDPCLVYQMMVGGSLESRLNNKNDSLDLRQRLNIAIGTARGLQYLHTFNKKPLIHGDIKPANILLDPCNQPKIGDFGLAREGLINTPMEVSKVYGTRPYLPAEFIMHCTLSTKVDTYSFGVVLFELATGLKAYDKKRNPPHAFLARYIKSVTELNKDDSAILNQLMDASFPRNDFTFQLFRYMLHLGVVCTQDDSNERPEMVKVLQYMATYLQQNREAFSMN